MSPDKDQPQPSDERKKTQKEKLDEYIAGLQDKTIFDYLNDRIRVLTVERSPDKDHKEPWPDSGWSLAIVGTDKDGVRVGIVEKLLHSDDEEPARKRVILDKAFSYSAENTRFSAPQQSVLEPQVDSLAIDPNIVPFDDPFSNAMTRAEVDALKSAKPESAEDDLDAQLRKAEQEKIDAYGAQLEAEKYGTDSYEFKVANQRVEAAKSVIEDITRQKAELRR